MELDANQLATALEVVLPLKRPVYVWGSPGIGKSDIIKQLAQRMGVGLIDLRLSLLNPLDLRGIPFAKDGEAVWLKPVFLPREGWKGILFLDELNVAPPTTQAAAYQLVLDRKVGEYVLPEGVDIIAAGNKLGEASLVFDMPAPLKNRFLHLELKPTLDSWKDWAYKNEVHPTVIAFLNWKPDMLFKFDPTRVGNAFPTPRTWEMTSDVTKVAKTDTMLKQLVTGTVGEGPCIEFIAYKKMQDALPDVKAILEGGDVTLPTSPDILYALIGALVGHTVGAPSTKALTYMRSCFRIGAKFTKRYLNMSNAKTWGVLIGCDMGRTPLFKKLLSQIVQTTEWKEYEKEFGNVIRGAYGLSVSDKE